MKLHMEGRILKIISPKSHIKINRPFLGPKTNKFPPNYHPSETYYCYHKPLINMLRFLNIFFPHSNDINTKAKELFF